MKLRVMLGILLSLFMLLTVVPTAYGADGSKGIDLTVWVLPFAAVAGAGVLLYFVLKAWAGRGKDEEENFEEIVRAAQPNPAASDEYRDRLEQELRNYKQEESR